MSFFINAFSGLVCVASSSAAGRSHASRLAANMRKDPIIGPLAQTIQIRPAAGAPVEVWAKSGGRWSRVTL